TSNRKNSMKAVPDTSPYMRRCVELRTSLVLRSARNFRFWTSKSAFSESTGYVGAHSRRLTSTLLAGMRRPEVPIRDQWGHSTFSGDRSTCHPRSCMDEGDAEN